MPDGGPGAREGAPLSRPADVSDSLTILRQALAASYRVEREIGEGGMATVFLATDLKHQRPVAIKVLRPELALSLGPERFLREIEIAARLQHPNIVPVYDSGKAGDVLYYVMPFVEGESLRDRIVQGGALPAAEAVAIAREVADAIDYAHRQGIVHRDIKPANILISQGHAVVADFGVARAVSASAASGLTQVGMAVGSPAYMSPEQALGSDSVDGRTDVFALGVVLFEMLEGSPPFTGTTPQAIIAQALSGQPRRLTRDPLGVQPIIDRALAREPEDRFPTAADFRAALDGLTTGTRPAIVPPRRRALLVGGVVAAIAAAAALLLPRGYRIDGNPRQSLIVFPFENQTGDASRDYLENAAMNLLGLAASHWRDMRVYDDERTASLLRRRGVESGSDLDFAVASEMAREARVGTLVLGDIRREGDSLAIEAKVHDVRSGDRIHTFIERAPLDADPRPLFDRIAAQLLGTGGAPPGERPSVLAQTTSSLEAYRAYLAGAEAFQRFQVDSARALLLQAVALDSAFALAYLRLADVEGWGITGDLARRRQYVLAAERHSESLPPRLRSLVAFHRAYTDAQFRRARQIVSELIARDSTDVEAWYQLGEAHFHDNAPSFPHPDSLGNIGHALRAFQRALALDSSFILAYQHIIDALRACVNTNTWLCMADSAVYGTPAQLEQQYGAATIAQLREEGRQAQLATARGWVTVAPNTARARHALVAVLFELERYDEVEREADGLARVGGQTWAALWKSRVAFVRGEAGRAALVLDSGLASVPDTARIMEGTGDFMLPISLLSSGGRVDAAERLGAALVRAVPVDRVNGPGNIPMTKVEIGHFLDAYVRTQVGLPSGEATLAEVWRVMTTAADGDSTRLRAIVTNSGSSLLAAYLASRDTTILTRFLALADTTGSSTWRVAEALLALVRGDTARARMRVDRHFRQPSPTEFTGSPGIIRAFGWGDLLARLGEPRLAIDAYTQIDSNSARLSQPGLAVRSHAERGALYQLLGDVPRAIEHYERFITAWEYADSTLQPAVERAREAVRLLRSGARPVQPPPPA